MGTDVRLYTTQELTALLEQTRLPIIGHHPVIGMLVSMTLMTDMVYLIKEVKDDPDWTDVVMPIVLKQILSGTAQVITRGVRIDRAPKTPKAQVN
jgi:hypothetical protein